MEKFIMTVVRQSDGATAQMNIESEEAIPEDNALFCTAAKLVYLCFKEGKVLYADD